MKAYVAVSVLALGTLSAASSAAIIETVLPSKMNRVIGSIPAYTDSDMVIGRHTGSSELPQRSYLQFDEIDDFATITDAKFVFFAFGPVANASMTIAIHQVEAGWTSISWNVQPAFTETPAVLETVAWKSPGAQPYSNPYELDVTSLVQSWIDGSQGTHAFVVKQNDETINQDIWQLYRPDWGAEFSYLTPHLVITGTLVPEPGTMALLSGLAGAVLLRRRRH